MNDIGIVTDEDEDGVAWGPLTYMLSSLSEGAVGFAWWGSSEEKVTDDGSCSELPAAAATLRGRLVEVRVLSAEELRIFRVFPTIDDAIFSVAVLCVSVRERWEEDFRAATVKFIATGWVWASRIVQLKNILSEIFKCHEEFSEVLGSKLGSSFWVMSQVQAGVGAQR